MSALNLKLVCVAVFMCLLVADLTPTAALTCGDVLGKLLPCRDYVASKKSDASPSRECCDGVRDLYDQAMRSGKADRQTACKCLKQLAAYARDLINPVLVEKLPNKCSVNLPYKISTSTDCNKVN